MDTFFLYLLSSYQDPMYLQMIVFGIYLAVGSFLFFALPWTFIAYLDPECLQPYKIQKKPFLVRQYFWPNLKHIGINSSIMLLIMILLWPLFRQVNTIHTELIPAWYIIVLQLAFFILLDDFLYYWMHRMLHLPWFLRHVHGVHHEIKNPCALDGNYFHWVEFVATASLMLIPPLLISAHLYVLYIWIVFRQFEAADGHCGYDLPYNPVKLIPLYKGAAYHDFHHARFKGNYAGFLPYLDRWLGQTYITSFSTYLENRKQGLLPAQANENNRIA